MTKTYIKDGNNGVVAIMTKEVYEENQARKKLMEECIAKGLPQPQLPPILPVFSFARPDHTAFDYMTGSFAMLERLLVGQEVEGGAIWVPFSNALQWRGGDEAKWELIFMTSLDQVFEAFPHIKIGE